jgi:hypothetical protein
MNTGETIARALAVADTLGLPVFPCCGSDKSPATVHGFKDAVKDPDAIRHLWRRRPGDLIGVPTGAASGTDVLDIDPRHGGHLWLEQNAGRLPATRTHRTRSGGWHFLFACNRRLRNSESKIAPGVDVRATGGYMIWWPALGLAVDYPQRLAPWPGWLLAMLLPPPKPRALAAPITVPDLYVRAAVESGCERVRRAPKGCRNSTLNSEAFALARFVETGAIGERKLADALADAAAAAGLPAHEIAGTLASALRARGAA